MPMQTDTGVVSSVCVPHKLRVSWSDGYCMATLHFESAAVAETAMESILSYPMLPSPFPCMRTRRNCCSRKS